MYLVLSLGCGGVGGGGGGGLDAGFPSKPSKTILKNV